MAVRSTFFGVAGGMDTGRDDASPPAAPAPRRVEAEI